MSLMPTETDRFENMERVADLSMKGWSPTAISKETGLQRKVVIALLEDYRTALSQDSEARDMARDHLNQMVKHFDSLIKKFYDLVDEIDYLEFGHQVAAQKNSALKAIAELESKRVDALQKAGLLDSAELGDELALAEEQRGILIEIIQSEVCDSCRSKIAYKLSKVTADPAPADYEVEAIG